MQDDFLSWVQFGDLHIRCVEDENYLDFLNLIADANEHLLGEVDFAFLPGDNADDGAEDQYRLVRSGLERLKIPVHVIAGDHDKKGGSLDLFRRFLEPSPYRLVDLPGIRLPGFRLMFLNAMDGPDSKTFDFSATQLDWIEAKMFEAQSVGLRLLVFTHLYPCELVICGSAFTDLIRLFNVELVSMGHTHYNELANDGHTLYSATRSTGQIEEGPPGFSITTIDRDVVSWKFKESGEWPFVIITSPADERLITRPQSARHIVRDQVLIRAKIWGGKQADAQAVTCSLDKGPEQAMRWNDGHWELHWNSRDVADGRHHVAVRVVDGGAQAQDEITVLVNQSGAYIQPTRSSVDYENAIGAYPAKGIFGTQLGPNENGTKGPWPSWR